MLAVLAYLTVDCVPRCVANIIMIYFLIAAYTGIACRCMDQYAKHFAATAMLNGTSTFRVRRSHFRSRISLCVTAVSQKVCSSRFAPSTMLIYSLQLPRSRSARSPCCGCYRRVNTLSLVGVGSSVYHAGVGKAIGPPVDVVQTIWRLRDSRPCVSNETDTKGLFI